MRRRRVAAALALVLTPLAVLSAVAYVADDVAQAFSLLLSFALAVAAGWFGLVRRGVLRVVGLVLAALLVAGVIETLFDSRVIDRVVIVRQFWLALAAATAAFAIHVHLPKAARPRRPVLFINPRSGDGKGGRLHLADAARERGIAPIELRPGDDLATLARAAVDDGADALAMAGGDGFAGGRGRDRR
jgi:hypothetical protein